MSNDPEKSQTTAAPCDDAEVMRLWRECGLPEYFLVNAGSNHKLVAFANRLRQPISVERQPFAFEGESDV